MSNTIMQQFNGYVIIEQLKAKGGRICIHSNKVQKGDLFVALVGNQADGHDFILDAITRGADYIVYQKNRYTIPNPTSVNFIAVDDTHVALAALSNCYYNYPSQKLVVVGVTGTNGKTTVATLLFQLFRKLGYSVGLLSTVVNKINENSYPTSHTTLDALSLQAMLHQMVTAGCTHVFMECSSHAIDQKRIAGMQFKGGIFTNLTHDHLDYHKTIEIYAQVKQSFFSSYLTNNSFAIANCDDPLGFFLEDKFNMLAYTEAKRLGYRVTSPSSSPYPRVTENGREAVYAAVLYNNHITGLHLDINGTGKRSFRLVGKFNAYNLLAVYVAAVQLHADEQAILNVLQELAGAEGRFDCQTNQYGVTGVVDYAHTPDALVNVLETIQAVRGGHQPIITVVGCGGNRDKLKRPIMAKLAYNLSDYVFFTTDNPRFENPQDIITDMLDGLASPDANKYKVQLDREQAIKEAVAVAHNNKMGKGIVAVVGKGHEKYQEIQGTRYDFDDKIMVSKYLSAPY
ncbi:MAG: UDP-N-acetylmuramoyl-L-alanyl-D-glutamate--2,6-diaminopimelate ligase [Phycisphaerales bacterium]|nr:UDP-N-acetylmuramoyl-L-alanyl-D-glutamate--2,6-diaminopimelate ligase [Phycisphaerales bacterium]